MIDELPFLTWRGLLKECAGTDNIIANTLSEDELDTVFYDEDGEIDAKPFTAWSKLYVYFPVEYDGSVRVKRILRHVPSDLSSYTPPDQF